MTQQPIKPSSDTPSHIQTAERMRAFASHLRANPEAAKAFREKTGVFDSNGELTKLARKAPSFRWGMKAPPQSGHRG